MRLLINTLLLFWLAGFCTCSEPVAKEAQSRQNSPASSAQSERVNFLGHSFLTYSVDIKNNQLQLFHSDKKDRPYRNFKNLIFDLNKKKKTLLFAMNGGMYLKDNSPQGLYIENGKEIKKLNTKKHDYGNFYLEPNGVFAFSDSEAIVQETASFEKNQLTWNYATQSGPMLVIDGQLHPKFRKGSKNLHIRNGVGISSNGKIIFAISEKRVNFHTFASLFRDHFHCSNALYLDGAISKIYIPNLDRRDSTGNLGPLIAHFL